MPALQCSTPSIAADWQTDGGEIEVDGVPIGDDVRLAKAGPAGC